MHRYVSVSLLAALLVCSIIAPGRASADGDGQSSNTKPATPIKYLVVIFDENNSFDHYFGTYPVALNPPGEPAFHAVSTTPTVNGFTPTLLSNNPNQLNATNPFRLDRSDSATCDNDNHYRDEQEAFDAGFMDKFNITSVAASCGAGFYFVPDLAMGYYDGNTVTALWNYAQHFAMSDNFFDTEFGTTVMGHLNLISGETNGVIVEAGTAKSSQISNGSIIANVQPYWDDCAVGNTPNVAMTGTNIGNLLTNANVTWGWFYGDFAATSMPGTVPATCSSIYNSHYDPFNYYESTSNPHHLPPTSVAMIGTNGDQANHQYDLSYFWQALANGNLPAVSFLKASVPNTGHPMDSSPLAEQAFLVNTINELQASPYWQEMAIIIAYDDSDGWYDHAAGPIVNPSNDPSNDGVVGSPTAVPPTGACSSGPLAAGANNDRCGFGVRLPFVVISPFAKKNYVDHSLNDTTSILRFIEQNWEVGKIGDPQSFDTLAGGSIMGMFDFDHPSTYVGPVVILNPTTGLVVK